MLGGFARRCCGLVLVVVLRVLARFVRSYTLRNKPLHQHYLRPSHQTTDRNPTSTAARPDRVVAGGLDRGQLGCAPIFAVNSHCGFSLRQNLGGNQRGVSFFA